MSATGVAAFDSTLAVTHVWLNEICEEIGWERNPHRAYHSLNVVLHALGIGYTPRSWWREGRLPKS